MSKSQSATIGILLVCFIWGVEFVLVHNAIAVLDPHSFNFFRFGIASLFIGLCKGRGNWRTGLNLRLIKRGCFLGLLLYFGFTFETFGLVYTTVSNCAFITSLSVVMVPVVAFFALGHQLRRTTIVGVSVAAAGLYFLTVAGDLPLNIGDFLTFTVNSTIPSNDVNPSNNSKTISIPVVNSYDPNTKQVEPAGVGAEGFISDTTSTLTYTVNFQNTGNAEALEVKILDTLGAHVLPKSLKIIDASHQMNPVWVSNEIVRFDFHNIHLPDSTSDEPNSHGFVTFRIDLDNNLSPGTEIENKAYIYFDYNPPIITNTALNTIEEGQTSSLQEQSGYLELKVYPNPMTESTTFSVQNMTSKDLTLKVYNMTGELVKTINRKDVSEIVLHKGNLESGIYLYKIQDNETQLIANGRLVVE